MPKTIFPSLRSPKFDRLLGQSNPLVTPHREYKRLGATDVERQAAYRQLFRARIPEITLEAIREATNKAWVLGGERFKRQIAKQLDRPVASGGHGGDRRSEAYRRAANNQRV